MKHPSTVVLMMQSVEAAFFSNEIHKYLADVKIVFAQDADGLQNIIKELEEPCAMISFLNPVIVPKDVLNMMECGAFNIHPGPPSRPGYRPVEFAYLDGADQHGSTLHRMEERVDSGEIIAVEYYDCDPKQSFEEYETKAYMASIGLAVHYLPAILGFDHFPVNKQEKWNDHKWTSKELNARKKCA